MIGMQLEGPIAHSNGLYGAGLGAPIAHGYGLYGASLGVPITPVNGFGNRRWKGYESLAGLGVSDEDLEAMAQQLARDPYGVTASQIADLMKGMSKSERETFSAKLIAAGVSPAIVTSGKTIAGWQSFKSSPASKFWAVASAVSMAASAYHGYRRNDSIGWALGWGALGAIFPIITPTIAVAQGFGKPK